MKVQLHGFTVSPRCFRSCTGEMSWSCSVETIHKHSVLPQRIYFGSWPRYDLGSASEFPCPSHTSAFLNGSQIIVKETGQSLGTTNRYEQCISYLHSCPATLYVLRIIWLNTFVHHCWAFPQPFLRGLDKKIKSVWNAMYCQEGNPFNLSSLGMLVHGRTYKISLLSYIFSLLPEWSVLCFLRPDRLCGHFNSSN